MADSLPLLGAIFSTHVASKPASASSWRQDAGQAGLAHRQLWGGS
jgi:hypothetical protein